MSRYFPARRRRGDQGGFALIATLVILVLGSLIILGLLSYTFTTTNFAGRQAQRDDEIQAADGAMETMLNQIVGDDKALLGSTKTECTPDGQEHPFGSDAAQFRFEIDGKPVDVECFTEESGIDPDPEVSQVSDTVNIVGDSYDGDSKVTECAGGGIPCADWTAATGRTAGDVAATSPTVQHVGSSPLWWTADQVRVGNGSAGLRNPIDCDGDTNCPVGEKAGPAFGVTGSYVQGDLGLFKGLDGDALNNTNCGLLQLNSKVPGAQVKTPRSPRTVCGDSIVGAYSYKSTVPVVPGAPLDASGIEVGSQRWNEIHMITKLADGRPIASAEVSGCPDTRVVTFTAGAYSRESTAILNKWFRLCNNENIYWFQPGDYWFDMYDASLSGDARNQLTFSSQARWVFGTPNGSIDAVDTLTGKQPLCNVDGPGVSIVLSGRTSIKHTRGRVGICGSSAKATIYQGTSTNVGWQAAPTTAKWARKAFRKSAGSWSGGIGCWLSECATMTIPDPVNTTALTPGTVTSGFCDDQTGWNPIFLTDWCGSQTVLEVGPTTNWGPANPGHVRITNATVQVTADTLDNPGVGVFGPEASTSIAVFNPPNSANPVCGVYYKGVPDEGETISYDLFDDTKTKGYLPSCRSVIKYSDDLYNSKVKIGILAQSACQFQLFNGLPSWLSWLGCSRFGPNVTNIAVTTGWSPSGVNIGCSITQASDALDTRCTHPPKDDTEFGSLQRSPTINTATGLGQSQIRVQCRVKDRKWYQWLYGGRDDGCGSNPSAQYNYRVTDLSSPQMLRDGVVKSLGVMIKGSSFCTRLRKSNVFGYSDTCGPYLQSWQDDARYPDPWDVFGLDNPGLPTRWVRANGDRTSTSYTNWKSWSSPANGNGARLLVQVLNKSGSVMCQVDLGSRAGVLPEHDETRYVAMPLTGGCSSATNLNDATVRLTVTLGRDGGQTTGCNNEEVFGTGLFNNGNFCNTWGYNLDWVGLTATSSIANAPLPVGQPTPSPTAIENDYTGPPAPMVLTQFQRVGYSQDAVFNVYGQVVLPRTDIDVAWDGPTTGNPIIDGTAPDNIRALVPAGEPTLVAKAVGSRQGKRVSATAAPAVGILCCAKYQQDGRRATLVARIGATPGVPGSGRLLGVATVLVSEPPQGSETRKVDILDWRLCNRALPAYDPVSGYVDNQTAATAQLDACRP